MDVEMEAYTTNYTGVINEVNYYATGMTSDWAIPGDVLYYGVNNILILS